MGATPINPMISLARQPLAQELVQLIENKIITRELAPGTRLVEEELSLQYGISRTPLREVLRLLEASSLVVRQPRRSVRVAPMTRENLDQVFACRVPLEALAAASVAALPEYRRIRVVAALQQEVAHMADRARAADMEGGFRANVALTDILHRECANPVLTGLLAQLNKPALRYRHWAYLQQSRMLPLAVENNAQMVDAIRQGDGARADAVTRALVQAAWKMAHAAFVARPPQD